MYYLNGKIYQIEPMNDDFFYGFSLFETMYGFKGKIYFFEEHIKRLKDSMEKIGMNVGFDIKKVILNFLNMREKSMNEFMIKIQISEKNCYMKITPFEGREASQGIEAEFIKEFYQNEMGYIKSGNYLGNILARKTLKGFEGVFLNRQGYITEGTISNIFYIKNRTIYTPSLDLNILPGITRGIIIKLCRKNGFEVQEGHFTKNDILSSEGVFFTNSLMKRGLLWVSKFENEKKIKTDEIHKLEKEYFKLVEDML